MGCPSPHGIAAMKHNQGIPGLHISHRIHGAGIYANITGLMGSMLPYMAYIDPMGMICC